jgi:2,3,4,5-tetrahydropyridine-2,6-dicarboxylate N-succinyltransferase
VPEPRELIDRAYEDLSRLPEAEEAVHATIAALDRGEIRVAEQVEGEWIVNEWVKRAILLYFRIAPFAVSTAGPFEYHDRIPTKRGLAEAGVRVVPPGTVRYGAFCEPGVVVMPGYVNIGARVGAGTMIDTWATVGSCAQVGRHVHISGGVGIGGVLEPPSARPVIIEDGAFIGSRCILVEGVVIEEGAVLGANTVVTSSTPIVDVTGPEPIEYRGRVPARAVVVPGTRPKKFPAGTYDLACALIIGERSASTDRKTSLNEALRVFGVQA